MVQIPEDKETFYDDFVKLPHENPLNNKWFTWAFGESFSDNYYADVFTTKSNRKKGEKKNDSDMSLPKYTKQSAEVSTFKENETNDNDLYTFLTGNVGDKLLRLFATNRKERSVDT